MKKRPAINIITASLFALLLCVSFPVHSQKRIEGGGQTDPLGDPGNPQMAPGTSGERTWVSIQGTMPGVVSYKSIIGMELEVRSDLSNKTYKLVINEKLVTDPVRLLERLKRTEKGDKVMVTWRLLDKLYLMEFAFTERKADREAAREDNKPVGDLSKFDQDKANKKAEITRIYTEGIGYFNNGNYEEALKIWQAVLVLDPKYAQAKDYLDKTKELIAEKEARKRLKKGEEYAATGKVLEALSEWQIAISTCPNNKSIKDEITVLKQKIIDEHNIMAKAKIRDNKVVEAIAECNMVLAIAPDDRTAKSTLEVANGKLNDLRDDERKNLQYENSINKAKEASARNDYQEALKCYKEAETIKPGDKTAGLKILEIQEIQNTGVKTTLEAAKQAVDVRDWLNAAREWRKCLKLDPKNSVAILGLTSFKNEINETRDKIYIEGLEAYGKEDFKAAIVKWQEVLVLDPDFTKAQLNIEKAQRKNAK